MGSGWIDFNGGRYIVSKDGHWTATKGNNEKKGWAATPTHAERAAKQWLSR